MKKRRIAIPLVVLLCAAAGVGAYLFFHREIKPDYGVYQYTDQSGTTSTITITEDAVTFHNFDFSEYTYQAALACRMSDVKEIKNEGGTVTQDWLDERLEHYLTITDYSRFQDIVCPYRFLYSEEEGEMRIQIQENGEDVPSLLLWEEMRTKSIRINDTICYTLRN